jgi:hypothetical protein
LKIGAHSPEEMKTSISLLFHSSDLFTANFFGETNEAVSHVTEGRFAHVQVWVGASSVRARWSYK